MNAVNMKRTIFLLVIFLLTRSSFAANSNGIYPDSSDNLKPVVRVSFASSNIRFIKDKPTQVQHTDQWDAVAWKGEKVHIQIMVSSDQDISELRIKPGSLKGPAGNIAVSAIEYGFLSDVITDEFGTGCGHRKPVDYDSSWVADPIISVSHHILKKDKMQPVWLSIKVPANTPAGNYQGTVTVYAGKAYPLKVNLKVLKHVLPPASEWKYDLDLWQHPAAIARVHGAKLWSDEHFKLMKPYYTMLASAGQKNITASLINEPWNHQTYDDFPGLIRWIKKTDGSWDYDYTLFDKYVSFVMSCGISKRINCYTMIPWNLAFRYFDEASGKDLDLEAKPGSTEYNEHWGTMLKDFTAHLKAKGWFDITSISMDERPMKDMQAVIALLKSVDPDWKITMAGDYHPEIEPDIFDYSIASRWEFKPEELARRKAEGKPSTWYTCCTEPYPNGFSFSPAAENAWLGWYSAAKGFTGYLRWAYNSWPVEPLSDTRFTAWPGGDTFQVYPGPVSSVRFEKLIEGVQDFEKIRILREQFTRTGNEAGLQKLNEILSPFELEALKTTPAAGMIEKAKAGLNVL